MHVQYMVLYLEELLVQLNRLCQVMPDYYRFFTGYARL